MLTNRTDLRRFLPDDDMPTVRTFPDHIAVLRKYAVAFDVGKQLPIALLVRLFDRANCFKQCGDLLETLFLCLLRKFLVHIRPLIVLASRSIRQIF